MNSSSSSFLVNLSNTNFENSDYILTKDLLEFDLNYLNKRFKILDKEENDGKDFEKST